MGRWRCPARVTALLLCKGWQEGDAEKEEEQLLLAGDVQVSFDQSCVWQFMISPYFLSRVVSGNMEEMVPPLSPPLSPAQSHPCVFTQVPSYLSIPFLSLSSFVTFLCLHSVPPTAPKKCLFSYQVSSSSPVTLVALRGQLTS